MFLDFISLVEFRYSSRSTKHIQFFVCMYITKGVIQVVNCYMYLNLKYSKYNCNQPLVQHALLFFWRMCVPCVACTLSFLRARRALTLCKSKESVPFWYSANDIVHDQGAAWRCPWVAPIAAKWWRNLVEMDGGRTCMWRWRATQTVRVEDVVWLYFTLTVFTHISSNYAN